VITQCEGTKGCGGTNTESKEWGNAVSLPSPRPNNGMEPTRLSAQLTPGADMTSDPPSSVRDSGLADLQCVVAQVAPEAALACGKLTRVGMGSADPSEVIMSRRLRIHAP
jgi:hypothetical protein